MWNYCYKCKGSILYYTVEFEPFATALEQEGNGYVVASLGKDSGYVPYTAYSAKKSYLEKHPEIIQKYTSWTATKSRIPGKKIRSLRRKALNFSRTFWRKPASLTRGFLMRILWIRSLRRQPQRNNFLIGEIWIFLIIVTVQQVCALAALTVRKHNLEDKNPIGAADLEWFLLVTMKILRFLII